MMKIREFLAITGLAAMVVACGPAADDAEPATDEAAEQADSEDEEQGKSRGPGG